MTSNSGSGAPTTGELLHSNEQAAAVAAAAALSRAAPADPVIPATSSEAVARLAEIKADPKWRDQYLAGSAIHAKEMRDLQAVIDADKGRADPQTEMAIAGVLFDGIQPSGHLAKVGTATMLREAGINDTGVIRQVLAGESVTQQERDVAATTKARLMKDEDFTAKYLAGDSEAKRTMTLLNIIVSSSIKSAAA
jgi:hypothetical protein